jgi:hypothetical protein
MTGISSGGGGGYDYVETYFPGDAEEGEDLYHLTENAAFVYTGSQWIEQTVTDHSQLSGVNEGDHRSDQRVSDLAPLQSVNGRTGDVTGLFEVSNYTPEADTHDRYTDSEARQAVEHPQRAVGTSKEIVFQSNYSIDSYETKSYTYNFGQYEKYGVEVSAKLGSSITREGSLTINGTEYSGNNTKLDETVQFGDYSQDSMKIEVYSNNTSTTLTIKIRAQETYKLVK